MNCTFAEKVSALIDGELPADEELSVERHLFACAECQQLRADFINLRSELVNYPLRPLPPMQPRLAERLPSRKSATPASFLDNLVAVFQTRKPLFAGAAAVLLLMLGFVVWMTLQSQRRDSGPDRGPALIAQDKSGQESSKGQPAPSPTASPEPANPPKREGKDAEETPPAPPKFRLREAITKERPRSPKSPEKSPVPDAAEAVAADLSTTRITAADAQSLTARHVEQSEVLLRSFRNLRPRSSLPDEISHERLRAEKLFYQNVMLRREADSSGDVEVSSLLESLEPILLDIANLPKAARSEEQRAIKDIKDRVERQNLVALLQINSRAQQRANE
ncbi:MAG TPA: zf-HC2 domain-containing protein [Pyrinomonadaceae bacterium]|nr:zf-HC2 domain-containing protein [Pyrinomonadaceae bacterium]